MIPETTAFVSQADFPPSDLSTGSRRKLSAPVLCFSDEEIIEALALWAAACGSLSTLRGLVTVGDALEASAVLMQAEYAQPEDLERILETTAFAPGFRVLLRGAWGAEQMAIRRVAEEPEIDEEQEVDEEDEPELSFGWACLRDFVRGMPEFIALALLALAAVLVLAVFGGHGWEEGAGK